MLTFLVSLNFFRLSPILNQFMPWQFFTLSFANVFTSYLSFNFHLAHVYAVIDRFPLLCLVYLVASYFNSAWSRPRPACFCMCYYRVFPLFFELFIVFSTISFAIRAMFFRVSTTPC